MALPADFRSAVNRAKNRSTKQRIVSSTGDGSFQTFGDDLLGQTRGTALNRRKQRNNHDIAALNASVFSAIRWREQAIARPAVVLEQRIGRAWTELGRTDEPGIHPLLDAIRSVNAGLTARHGMMGIERGKLTNGSHIWVKVRAGNRPNGEPVSFIVWDTSRVTIYPKANAWWEVSHAKRRNDDGSTTTVSGEDLILFRHIVDPATPLWGMTPISAIRMDTDTVFEAQRHNLRYFDNGIPVGQVLVPSDGDSEIDPVEINRMLEQMRTEWQGTDNAHRWHILERGLKPLLTPATMSDMQFAEQMAWSVEQVARAFELSPLTLKDLRRATYSNADQAAAEDWTTIQNQLDNTLDELNEFLVWPDFGTDLRLRGDYADIPALQSDSKEQAETDKIEHDFGKVSTNELRERDGLEPLPGGDIPQPGPRVEAVGALVRAGFDPAEALLALGLPPITHIGLPPVTVQAVRDPSPPPPEDAPAPPRSRAIEETPNTEDAPKLLSAEVRLRTAWGKRLRAEMQRILDSITDETERGRAVADVDVEAMNWDWQDRYFDDVASELSQVHATVLAGESFLTTPLLEAHQVANSYAAARSAELLSLEGSVSVVRTTRLAMRRLIGTAMESNWTVRQLKNAIRDSFEFSPSRSEMIARTEIAASQGKGANQAARTQGRDEKRWFTARDERVDGGDASGPCIEAQRDGWISIEQSFNNGRDTVPAHPRCRCDVEYRTSRLQP
jgi:HK97 family phage portal protein